MLTELKILSNIAMYISIELSSMKFKLIMLITILTQFSFGQVNKEQNKSSQIDEFRPQYMPTLEQIKEKRIKDEAQIRHRHDSIKNYYDSIQYCKLIKNNFSNYITVQDYYDFYNSIIIKSDSTPIILKEIPCTEDLFRGIEKELEDSTFSTVDKKFIYEQKKVSNNFTWLDGKLIGTKILSNKKYSKIFRHGWKGWGKFIRKIGKEYYEYSVPFFNVNKIYCLIYKVHMCGSLCGSGNTLLYKKIDGKWIFVKSYGGWVS